MRYRVLAAVCLLLGYSCFGNFGTIYFSNFNMGALLICLIYGIVFSRSLFELTSFHYYRFGSRNQLLKHVLWQQGKRIVGYMAVITALFLFLSLIYVQHFTFWDVMRFYLLGSLNLFLLTIIAALVKILYGNTACAFSYMCIVAGNILVGWIANWLERFAFLTFPFADISYSNILPTYLLVVMLVSILYIGYCRNDLK